MFKYASNAERQKAYRRRKMQAKIEAGLVSGVLNLETGRVRKWRNNGQRQRGWRRGNDKHLDLSKDNCSVRGFKSLATIDFTLKDGKN